MDAVPDDVLVDGVADPYDVDDEEPWLVVSDELAEVAVSSVTPPDADADEAAAVVVAAAPRAANEPAKVAVAVTLAISARILARFAGWRRRRRAGGGEPPDGLAPRCWLTFISELHCLVRRRIWRSERWSSLGSAGTWL